MKYAKFEAKIFKRLGPRISLIVEEDSGERKWYGFEPPPGLTQKELLLRGSEWAARILDPDDPNG